MQTPYGIHWFRRDLRVAGNPALKWNFQQCEGRTIGLFTFDSAFLKRRDFSHDRFQFFLHTLQQLKSELQAGGSDLLVVDGQPHDVFPRLLEHWLQVGMTLPKAVSFNRDYEPFARARDEKVLTFLRGRGIAVHTAADHLVLEPHEVKKDQGGYYQVFTPFARRWMERFQEADVQSRLAAQSSGFRFLEKPRSLFRLNWQDLAGRDFPFVDALEKFIAANRSRVGVPLPKAGSRQALSQLDAFASKLENYDESRDFPAQAGTSRLSIFLKNGSLTTTQIIARLNLHRLKSKAAQTFLKELIWREFYYHILYHRPDVETQAFLPQYRDLPWSNNPERFKRWQEGQTGFPIVDAGMRQLATTGWMHNRVRMIVASFLAKDLLINWQKGEHHFMHRLLDGDLAPNNGGWQWAASTGCDAQPYFRIFNPVLQSQRFDPQGDYIREFVPELRDVKTAELHDPARLPTVRGYAKPIVDHQEQKRKALRLYQGKKD